MWISDIESKIFTRVKVLGNKTLKEKYPDIYFTDSDKTQTNPKFPTVYIHSTGGPEKNTDLENTTINSILCTLQIDVTDNQSQSRAKEVMDEVVGIMKKMSFTVNGTPQSDNTDSTYRQIARFRRTIDWNDTL